MTQHPPNGGPAFPGQPLCRTPGGMLVEAARPGMSLRDYFAANAIYRVESV